MKKRLLTLILAFVACLISFATWAQTFTVTNTNNTFTITRSGLILPAQTVSYRTVSLSAVAGVHFTEATGTLQFGQNETTKTITITENSSGNINLLYRYQTGTTRTYRFEVLDNSGFRLAYKDRDITYGAAFQQSDSYLNKSVTDLVYFNNSGSIQSGSGNKYLDVSYSSSSWVQVTDGGYSQAVHTVSTSSLFNNNSALRSYLNNLGYKMYATVYFTQKEEQDGYQYIQILADNSSTYDGNDPNGAVNSPSTSLYKACFILSYEPSGSVMSDEHYQFFPHRYDYVDKAAELAAGISHYEFDYDNSHLYQQKYKSSTYNASNTGSLSLSPTVNNLNIRFDAAGSGGDTWDFKNLKVRLALVDANAPTVINEFIVSGGRHSRGNTIYVSVPFNEIVKVTGTPTLNTTWGTLTYVAGSGTNVLTFSGNISLTASGTFSVNNHNGTITDLSGNAFNGLINHDFGISINTSNTYTITYELNDGVLATPNPSEYTYETETFTLNNPTKQYYVFDGWTGSNGDTPQTTVTIPKGSIGDLHFVANFSLDPSVNYSITYDLDGGTLETPNPTQYNCLTETFTLNNPTKLHSTFVGWTGSNGDTPQTTVTIPKGSAGNLNFTANYTYDWTSSYIFDTSTGILYLNHGSFNKNNKWGSDVTPSAVTSVVVTSDEVSFTGDCSNLFSLFSNCESMDLGRVNTSEMTSCNNMFNKCSKLDTLDLSNWDTSNVTNMTAMFGSCSSLKSLGHANWNTSNVTNMSYMFSNCSSFTSIDVSNFNTANVTNFSNMFNNCNGLTSIDVSNFDTGNATNFSYMFNYCQNLTSLDLSSWNTSSATNMSSMFMTCEKLATLNLTGWNTSNVTNMSRMFQSCEAIKSFDFLNFDTGNVTNMNAMFYSCRGVGHLNLSNLDTHNVTDMGQMFKYCMYMLSLDISGWDTSNVTNMSQMFFYCSHIPSLDLSNLDTHNVTNMSSMFENCESLKTLDVSSWNTAKVTDMGYMFSHCNSMKSLNLMNFNTGNVTNMNDMFWYCRALNTIYVGTEWSTANVQSSVSMFLNCVALIGGKGTTYDSSHTDAAYAHIDGGPENPGYLTDESDNPRYTFDSATGALTLNWGPFNKNQKWGDEVSNRDVTSVTATSEVSFTGDCTELFCNFENCLSFDLNSVNTNNVTNMFGMFSGCDVVGTLDLSNWNTSNVTSMAFMFNGCNLLTSLDISNWNTANVTDMQAMFSDCHSIGSLDLSHFVTSNVTRMDRMFDDCASLNSLNISSFDTGNVTNMSEMFRDCEVLTSLDLSNFDTENVTLMNEMFSDCNKLTSLDLLNFDTGNVTDMNYMFFRCSALTSLKLYNWNTANVTNMSSMFSTCNALTSLDLSGWNTANVANMSEMFGYCTSLSTISAGEEWSTEAVEESSRMFYSCSQLLGSMGTTYDANHIDKEYAHIDGGPDNPGYFSVKVDVPRYTYNSETGELTLIWGPFNNANKWGDDVTSSAVTSVTATDEVSFFGDCSSLFNGFINCESMDLNNVKTTSVTNMTFMFDGCSALTSLDISDWNTTNVTDMHEMFDGCSVLDTLNISGWSTSNVTNMSDMFRACTSLTTIYAGPAWSTENVDNSSNMFAGCSALVGGMGTTYDVNHVDAEYARIDKGISEPGYFTLPRYTFNSQTGVLTLLYGEFNKDNKWGSDVDVDTVKSVTATSDVIFTGNCMGLFYHFDNCVSIDLNNVNTDNVTDMSYMFELCYALTSLNISNWNTSNVTNMREMFYGCHNLTSLDVSNFNTSCVTDMSHMFNGCKGLTSLDVSNFNTTNVTDMSGMFQGCGGLTSLDVSNFNTANATDMSHMFNFCKGLTSLDVSNFNTSNVTDMSGMFYSCDDLTSLDVSNFNTTNVTDISYMFQNCEGLTSLDVSNFNTANVTGMQSMFNGCSNLNSLDISSFDTGNVTIMIKMFYDCSSLTTIYVGAGWSTDSVEVSNNMFLGCTSLVGGMGTEYDENHIDAEYARIDGGTDCPGYFTDANPVVVVPGDVNGDGSVTASDVTEIYNYLLNGDQTYINTADVNGDGAITSADITAVYSILLGN